MENIIFIYIGTNVAHIEQPCIYSFALGMSIKMPSLESKIKQVCVLQHLLCLRKYICRTDTIEYVLSVIILLKNLRYLTMNLDIIKFSRQKCDKIML